MLSPTKSTEAEMSESIWFCTRISVSPLSVVAGKCALVAGSAFFLLLDFEAARCRADWRCCCSSWGEGMLTSALSELLLNTTFCDLPIAAGPVAAAAAVVVVEEESTVDGLIIIE